MVKFSNGMWWNADGVVIDWATEIIKSENFEKYIRCIASSKRINHRGDTLNTPTLTIECGSPIPDVLLLRGYHWKAQKTSVIGDYELFPGIEVEKLASERQDNLRTSKTDTSLTIATNSISATVDTRPASFNIDIFSHNTQIPTSISRSSDNSNRQLLTKFGWRSIGYIKRNTNSLNPTKMLKEVDKGERWFTMQFQLSVGEKIYGLGERFGPFIKNGQIVEMWNEDGGTSSDLTYKNVPFLLSSRGYGIFIPCSGFVSFEVQSERTTRINIAAPYETLSAYIIHGPDPKSIIQLYTLLTGRPSLPPPWSFGLWLSTSFTTSYDEKTVNSFLDGMEERDIPVGIFHFDCFWQKGFHWCDYEFDEEFFPDAKGQLRRLKEKGYRICVWINPYIAQESKIFDEGVVNNYFIKRSDGSVWQTDFWQAGMAIIDFTNPDACKWYQSKLHRLMDLGVDCFKTDFGERIPIADAVYYNSGAFDTTQMHNYYPFLYNKVTFQAIETYKGKNQALVFARSATAGCQRFPVHWGGDPMSTPEAMAETLRGGMSLGLCGFGYWAHDIGGFEGTPNPGLYKRWFAFGALSSHSRLHGSGSYRVPWVIDPDNATSTSTVLSKFIHLKHTLLPYIYSAAIKTHQTGIPVLRPTFLEFPTDHPAAWIADTQYMLGSELLVMPVFDQEEEGWVEGYVPEGRWWGLLDGKIRRGPGYIRESHGYDSLPLLLRPGGVVVVNSNTWNWDTFTHITKPDGKRSSAVYDYAESPTILVNPFEEEEREMDAVVEIPDVDIPGKIKAAIRVTGSQKIGGLKVEVIEGQLRGSWAVRKISQGSSGEVSIANLDEAVSEVLI